MSFQGRKIKLPNYIAVSAYDYSLNAATHRMINGLSSLLQNQGIKSSDWSLSHRMSILKEKYSVISSAKVFWKFKGKDAVEIFHRELYEIDVPDQIVSVSEDNDSRQQAPIRGNFQALVHAASLEYQFERIRHICEERIQQAL